MSTTTIGREDPEMIQKTCDIVVIGGGGSGLVAGARAAAL
jgi:succinate dehydrogenase/fumarate reductase flavoprotein subunit